MFAHLLEPGRPHGRRCCSGAGRITLRQLADAATASARASGSAAILVEQGVLSPKELVAAVVEHTQEIIYGAFPGPRGSTGCRRGRSPPRPSPSRSARPDIILEGIRRIESWTRIERAVGGRTRCYERAPAYEEAIRGHDAVAPRSWTLLRRPDASARRGGICAARRRLSDFEVCRALWAFRVIGLVRRVDAGAPSRAEIEDESLGIVVPEE